MRQSTPGDDEGRVYVKRAVLSCVLLNALSWVPVADHLTCVGTTVNRGARVASEDTRRTRRQSKARKASGPREKRENLDVGQGILGRSPS